MEERNSNSFLLAFIILALGVCLLVKCYHKADGTISKTDTVTVEKEIVIHDTVPEVRTETIIKTIKVPVEHVKENGDSLYIGGDIENNLSDSVTLDFVQRKYTDDSTYTVYVSGLKYGIYPRLDSIMVRRRTIDRAITKYVTQKQGLKIKLRPAVGGGYDPANRQWGVYIGGALVLDW